MSLRCADAIIQAAAFSGTPFSCHAASADAKASCSASSARSNEPEIRIRQARIRPDASRNTASATERKSSIRRCGGQSGQRPNLDAALTAFAGRGDLGGPLDGLVQILAVENVIPRKLLFGLGERAVADQRFSSGDAHRSGSGGGGQRLGRNEDAFASGLFHHLPMAAVIARGGVGLLLRI